jgi:hypothetical protein
MIEYFRLFDPRRKEEGWVCSIDTNRLVYATIPWRSYQAMNKKVALSKLEEQMRLRRTHTPTQQNFVQALVMALEGDKQPLWEEWHYEIGLLEGERKKGLSAFLEKYA